MNGISERIIILLEETGMKQKDFATSCGFSAITLQKMKAGEFNPSLRNILLIYNFFQNQYNKTLSFNWLLLGLGDKFVANPSETEKLIYLELLKRKDEEITALNREIGQLEERISPHKG